MMAAGAIGWHLGAREGSDAPPAIGAGVADEQLRLNRLMRERDTALASVVTLRDSLVEAERRQADDAAELALYRRLSEKSTESGLGIDTVRWHDDRDGQAMLDITLVQAKGRSRVSGTLGVSVLSADETDDTSASVELVPEEGAEAAAFDLRFFQTVSVPVERSGAIEQSEGEVAISVRPEGERHAAFVDIRPLDSILPALPGE